MTDRTPVLVDCDTGIDDAMALLYLLAREDIEIVGITTVFGNNTAARCAHNSLRVLELAGATEIPVAVGAEEPLVGAVEYLATHVHGGDGLGDAGLPDTVRTALSSEPATALISRLAAAHAGVLRILAIGPLTNLALAVQQDPELVGRTRDLVVMGGAADCAGNQTPAAEANIVHDPEAAQQVMSAGWPVTLVPLDVTMREVLEQSHRDRLAASGTAVGRFVASITDFYFDGYGLESYGRRASPCHDALAAGILTGEVVPLVAPAIPVEVDCTNGPSRGATVCDTRGRWRGFPDVPGSHCRVVLETDGSFADRLVAALGARTPRWRE